MIIPAVVLAVVYGLLFGSFANAVAYRVPTGETLMTRSHCPKCDAKITAWQNIPVLSWVFLGGKCANCKDRISVQYPLIELLTSALFGLVTFKVFSSGVAGDGWAAVLVSIAFCYFAFIGVVLSIIDFNTMKLPTKLIYPTAAFSFLVLTVAALLIQEPSRILSMFIGAVGSFLILFILWMVFPRGIGFGDVRLILLTGGILGWLSIQHAILGIISPYMISALILLPLLIFKVVNRKSKIPFGPWIIIGALVSIMFGDILISTYLPVGGIL